MTKTKNNLKPETVCTRFARLELDPKSIAAFIDWLCGMEPMLRGEYGVSGEDPTETTWGWNAPRHRMAKLLWQHVHGKADDSFFHQNFSYGNPLRTQRTAAALAPIQKRIRWVLAGATQRLSEDRQIGQGDWGECWWLPVEQTDYVRKQLRKVAVDIVQQQSEYDNFLVYYLNTLVSRVAKSISVPSRDGNRSYVGVRDAVKHACFVNVLDEGGKEYPLRHFSHAYIQEDGTGFEWGYGGGGPYDLAEALLTDALDGDFGLCDMSMAVDFRARFIETYPRDEEFRLSRKQILEWIKARGALGIWKERRSQVVQGRRALSKKIKEGEERLRLVRRAGGLLAQRFDLVPSTFEAALCLDLTRMLQSSDYAMQCGRCKLPIPHDGSARANHQRARVRRGQAVYHEACRQEQARLRKKLHWRRKATANEFREAERERSRLNRSVL